MFFVVPQSHCVILERLGKFNRVCRQGLHFRIPLIDSPRLVSTWGPRANKDGGWLIELTEQQIDTPSRTCHTKDNVEVRANASVYWRIIDPVKAVYEVDILPQSVADLALNALRANIGALDLDTVLSERQRLNERIAAQLAETAQKWGIQFTRVEIQEIATSSETASAMRQQMEAERRRRAAVSDAEGRAEAELRVAKAEREAQVIRAEGRAKSLTLLAQAELDYLTKLKDAVGAERAAQLLLAQKFLGSLEKITENPAHKVFMPNWMPSVPITPIEAETTADSLKAVNLLPTG